MTRPPLRRVRVLLVCVGDELAQEREHLVTVALPRLGQLLTRRDIALEVELGLADTAEPNGAALAAELTDLGAAGTVVLCVVGSTYGPPLETLPLEVEERFPHLLPYAGCSRLELSVRHLLAGPPMPAAVFVLRTVADRRPATSGLRRAILSSGARVVPDDTPAAPVDQLAREIVATLWQEILVREPGLPAAVPVAPLHLDENVQFTVYRPRAVRPAEWYEMLAFAHLAERRPDAPAHEADPLAQVRAQAARLLGPRLADYDDPRSDSRQGIPRDGTITFLPQVPGVEFNPERRVFRWQEDVHREEFRLRAGLGLRGQTARGRMSVYLGAIIVAELDLALRVDDSAQPPAGPGQVPDVPEQARPYRRIFASYSHRDTEIVRQFELLATSLGDEYLRDVVRLRSGDDWDAALRRLIDDADVFQLFWSSNSMMSAEVRREWEYALSLGRPQFIRPTYWEDPLPSVRVPELPPESLRRLHFHRISDLAAVVRPPAPSPTPQAWAAPGAEPPAAVQPSRRFRARSLVVPLAAAAVVAAGLSTFLAAERAASPGSTPLSGRTIPVRTPSPSVEATSPMPPVARLYSMEVTGARRIGGPQQSRPGEMITVYATRTGQPLELKVEFVNPTAVQAAVAVRTGMSCLSASGHQIGFAGGWQVVKVSADRTAKPGRDPVSEWQSAPVSVPADCRADVGSPDVDGLVWVESRSVSTGGMPTRISAGLKLA